MDGTSLNLRRWFRWKFPDFVCSMTHLQELKLSRNRLHADSFPEDLTNLVHLNLLYINDCHLWKIPSPVTRLTSLKKLNISRNDIPTCYTELRNLSNLEELHLSSCGLHSFKNMETLIHIKTLVLSDAVLDGDISGIEDLTSLTSLDLSNTNLSVLPLTGSKLISLQELDISSNPISSYNNIFDIPKLKKLRVFGSRLQEPNSIKHFTRLEELKLEDIYWRSIPESIVELTSLKCLYISDLGILNPTLFKFANLTELYLTSLISVSISDLFGCTILRLTDDEFDIKHLFPHLSEEMIQNIRLKETACLFPDLSEIKTLRYATYKFHSSYTLYVRKKKNEWYLARGKRGNELNRIEYDFKAPNLDPFIIMGRNGLFVAVPHSFLKLIHPNEEDIDIVECANLNYSIDSRNRVWYSNCERKTNLEQIEIKNISKIGCIQKYTELLFGIDDCGNVLPISSKSITLNGYNITKLHGNRHYALGVTTDGKLLEITSTFKKKREIRINDIVTDVIDAIAVNIWYADYGICIDEIGSIWVKQFCNPADIAYINFGEWKNLELPHKFIKLFYTHGTQVILLTQLGEVFLFDYRDIRVTLLAGYIPKLPTICTYNRYTHKNARK